MIEVKVINLSNNPLPKYETSNSAGMDVRADFSRVDKLHPIKLYGSGQFIPANEVQKTSCLMLDSGSRALIPTGIRMKMPDGVMCDVRPRSGLALKEGVTVCNTPGTIDSDYTNEVGVILINLSNKPVCIEDGERIAQLVFNTYEYCRWMNTYSLEDGAHKEGFGHTGKH